MTLHKLLIFLCISFMLIGCMNREQEENDSEPSYDIEGSVTGFSEGTKFYLYSLETNANVDSAIVKDNKFQMEGHIADPPGSFWLRATDGEDYVYTPLLIGNDELTISADKKDFAWNVKTSGSTIDSNYRKAMDVTKELNIKRDSLIFSYHAKPAAEKEEMWDEFMESVSKIDSVIKRKTNDQIKKTSDSYAGMFSLSLHKDDLPKDSVRIIFNRYDEKLKQSKFEKTRIEKWQKRLNKLKS